ncbi:MAG: SDR family oxidoreductase [Verrucomicrobia bacterium]|nr:SDR family oxidoreductase [Verrucomicrobiota bacterium]
MNQFDLRDKTAVVTGGASGIGAAIVARFVQSGANVSIWDNNMPSRDRSGSEAASQHLKFVLVDVTDLAAVDAATRETAAAFGRIDILVTSAGIAGPNEKVWNYPVEMWRKVQAVNVDGVFYCCRAIVPYMIKNAYGRIVNIASIAGKEGNPNASAYSASKAAVIALTKSLGKELANYDIAVNCITPAAAQTPILKQVNQEFIDYMLSKIPRGRFVSLDEIASLVAWMSSSENSFTTGAVFDISGGRATY